MSEVVETGLVQIIEGAILAADKPLTVQNLAELFEEPERPANTEIREALKAVAERCEGRGFELQEVASGYRFQVRQQLSPWVARLWVERPARYSRALLETLALIAYRQPITRGEIEEIRGVAVSTNIIKTLHERDWIRVVGHRDVPGRPAMYATTKGFLDYFNLKSLDQLPVLADIRDVETLTAELGFEPLPDGDAGQNADLAAAATDATELQDTDADSASETGENDAVELTVASLKDAIDGADAADGDDAVDEDDGRDQGHG